MNDLVLFTSNLKSFDDCNIKISNCAQFCSLVFLPTNKEKWILQRSSMNFFSIPKIHNPLVKVLLHISFQIFYSSKIKDEFPLVTFHIFHPNPDPTSNVRQNLVVYPVVLAECCVSLCFWLWGSCCFFAPLGIVPVVLSSNFGYVPRESKRSLGVWRAVE